MPIFTTTAAYLATTVGVTSAFGIAAINFGVRAVAAYALTRLISKRDSDASTASSISAPGTQMPPATDNKLPVVYGTSYVVPCIIDAKMSTDQTTMWYVLAISEHTDSGTMSFNRIWWGDKELIFQDALDNTKVTSWINSNDEENTNVSGSMYVYYYGNGSNDPLNSETSAITLLQDSEIPENERWTAYNLMSDCSFAVIKLEYNQNASLTGIEQVLIEATNTLDKPGSVILDYFTNTRYGCAIPLANVDTAALTALDTYSDQLIDYTDDNGDPATQPRYRINGIVNTDNPCMTNLQSMVDSCDSWIQWDEVNNNWSVIINRSYLDYTSYASLFQINSYNIIGGVDITPIDLNSTYNSVECEFHNTKIRDKADYVYSLLDPGDMSPNEPDNQLQIQLPYVNNSVQAQYISTRRLIQSREDLYVTLTTDYSGIQIEAGDVVRVAQPVYGWGPIDADPEYLDKLFRVSQVVEAKTEDGSLGAQITMFEYNDQVYANISIQDYTPSNNTGIPYPGWISTPGSPIITEGTVVDGMMSSLIISATVPSVGTVLYMDFYYGTSSDPSTHKLYRTVTPATGRAFVNGSTVSITVNDIPRGVYYWSIKARGSTSVGGGQSQSSDPSAPSTWDALKVLAPALVAGQLLGGIAKYMLRPDAQPSAGGIVIIAGYTVLDDLLPVAVSTTSERNIPLIFPGTTVPGTEIFPWYQGTDPISTGPWLPAIAKAWPIGEGDSGWYKVLVFDQAGIVLNNGDYVTTNTQLYMLTDTANTIIQIASYVIVSTIPEDINVQTQTLQTILLSQVQPYPMSVALVDNATIEEGFDQIESGYVIRNMTPGSNVTVFTARAIWQQIPGTPPA